MNRFAPLMAMLAVAAPALGEPTRLKLTPLPPGTEIQHIRYDVTTREFSSGRDAGGGAKLVQYSDTADSGYYLDAAGQFDAVADDLHGDIFPFPITITEITFGYYAPTAYNPGTTFSASIFLVDMPGGQHDPNFPGMTMTSFTVAGLPQGAFAVTIDGLKVPKLSPDLWFGVSYIADNAGPIVTGDAGGNVGYSHHLFWGDGDLFIFGGGTTWADFYHEVRGVPGPLTIGLVAAGGMLLRRRRALLRGPRRPARRHFEARWTKEDLAMNRFLPLAAMLAVAAPALAEPTTLELTPLPPGTEIQHIRYDVTTREFSSARDAGGGAKLVQYSDTRDSGYYFDAAGSEFGPAVADDLHGEAFPFPITITEITFGYYAPTAYNPGTTFSATIFLVDMPGGNDDPTFPGATMTSFGVTGLPVGAFTVTIDGLKVPKLSPDLWFGVSYIADNAGPLITGDPSGTVGYSHNLFWIYGFLYYPGSEPWADFYHEVRGVPGPLTIGLVAAGGILLRRRAPP